MNCKGCNYPLWNLPDRRCPECGKDFYPSQYEFVPRAVRFLCPFCKQQYFGTDEHGHLVPRTFACVSCHNRITMDEMVLVPAEGVEERLTTQELNPWLDTQQRGVFNRWFATIGRSMTAPTRLIGSTPTESAAGRAFVFALVNILVSFLTGGATMAVMFLFMPSGPGMGLAALGFFGIMLGALAVIPIVWLLLWTLITHGILRISGPLPGGLRTTCRCMWYSSGPYVITAIPCLGSNLFSLPAALWWGISASIMLAKAHAISGLRAAVATFAPILILMVCVVAFFVVPIFTGFSTAMTFAGGAGGSAQTVLQHSRAMGVAQALLSYRNVNGGYPAHAADLIGNGVTAMDFSLSMDPLAPDAIPVGNTSLSQFELATPATRQQVLTQLQTAMPKNIIAYRVGNYVFTYHQLPANSPDPRLWVFIAEGPGQAAAAFPANSGAPPPPAAPPMYYVGLADGQVMPLPKGVMPQMLQAQNQVRATFNLPPLPDPSTVTSASPAVGPN